MEAVLPFSPVFRCFRHGSSLEIAYSSRQMQSSILARCYSQKRILSAVRFLQSLTEYLSLHFSLFPLLLMSTRLHILLLYSLLE